MTTTNHSGLYALDNDDPHAGQHHALLSELFDAVSAKRIRGLLLDLTGKRCLEVGAGGGGFAGWLAAHVGPSGQVLATDIKPHTITTEHPRLSVRGHDLRTDPIPTPATGGGWDLVHARLVLAHLPQRVQILSRLLAALAPGGVILMEDFDTRPDEMVLHAPTPHAADLYTTFQTTLSNAVFAASGTDRGWARRTHTALIRLGMAEVQTTAWWQSWPGGSPGTRFVSGMIDQTRDRLLAAGLTGDQLDQVRALLTNREFVLAGHTLISSSGRKTDGG